MEKDYLNALSNFAYALEELVEELKTREENTTKSEEQSAKVYNNLSEYFENIRDGIEQIKQDNQRLIANQETLIRMAKDGEKSGGLISGVTDKDNQTKMKDGISTIILIAGAVMAIGLAFRVVGEVDFGSVIALSIALPLIGLAFINIAKEISDNGIGINDMFMTSLAIVIMSVGILGSAYLLSLVPTIGLFQFITIIGVSLTLAIASYGMISLIRNLDDVNLADVLMLPLVLVAISTAILLSSLILSSVKEIPLMLLLNIALQGIALGIVSAVMIAPILLFKMFGLETSDVLMGTFNLVLIAGAISLSSHLLSMGNYSVAPPIDWALGASLSIVIFSVPVVLLGLLSMTGVGLAAIALGSIMTLMVAGTLMLSSHILSSGNYDKFPSLDWTGGVASSILLFGGMMTIFGAIALTGLGAIAMFAGGAIVLHLANTIVAVSEVLAKGNYTAGPTTDWTENTTKLFSLFAPMMVYLGAIGLISSVTSWFTGTNPFEQAKDMMVHIASTIVAVSFELDKGRYSGGPTEEWASAVSTSLSTFAPLYIMLSNQGIFSFFRGTNIKPDEFKHAIITIVEGITTAADKFAEGGIERWEGAPTKEWAEGVSLSLGAFAPVYEILAANQGIFKSGVSASDFASAVTMISKGIVDAANEFAKYGDTVYVNGPTKDWAEGVGIAVKSFTELYSWIDSGWSGWSESDIENANKVVFKMASSIITVAKIFQGYTFDSNGELIQGEMPVWTNYPSDNWINSVAGENGVLVKFSKLYEWVFKGIDWKVGDIKHGNEVIYEMAKGILVTGKILGHLDNVEIPNVTENIVTSIKDWRDFIETGIDIDTSKMDKLTTEVNKMADGFQKLADSLNNVGVSISAFKPEFISTLAEVSGVNVEISSETDTTDAEEVSWWDRILSFGKVKKEEETLITPSIEMGSPTDEPDMTVRDVYDKLEELNQNLRIIASSSKNMSEYVDELRTKGSSSMIGM